MKLISYYLALEWIIIIIILGNDCTIRIRMYV